MTQPYFTICSRNYLAYALTLRASLLAVAPGAAFLIFLADAEIDGPPPCDGIIPASALALPDFEDMAFRYMLMEFNTAIKPFCFEHVFDRLGAAAAVYLDPDILVLRPLDHVMEALESGAEAVVTPHVTAPPGDDGRSPSWFDLLASGVYNLGFAAFANTPEARRFIRWWARRCETDCVSDLSRGLFVDQKFAEFIPAFVGKTAVLRHPGYNVAYWNLAQRPVAKAGGSWTASGAPLHFFHFSGVVPGDPAVFSKHQNRHSPASMGPARALLEDYLARLDANGADRWRSVPYAYDRFEDGGLIPTEARRIYARAKAAGEAPVPFDADTARLNAPDPAVDQDRGAPITVYMAEIWRARPDLQRAFPLSSAAGRRGFHRWFLLHAEDEHRASAELLAPARAGLAGAGLGLAQAALRRLPPPVRKFLRRRSGAN